MLNVTFIQHSSFLIETEKSVLLFDYFPPGEYHGILFQGKLPEIPEDKAFYVFASHAHGDHFSLEVLRWYEKRPDVRYVLSKDIRLSEKYLLRNGVDPGVRSRIRFVSPGHHYDIDDLSVETIRSTDAGVAFSISCDGVQIYFAGDHHWWNAGERGELYGSAIGAQYKRELRHFENKHFDLAFVVLDGRLGDGFSYGMEYFLQKMDADLVFPMHLWQEYDLVPRLKRLPSVALYRDKVVDIDRENIVFRIE